MNDAHLCDKSRRIPLQRAFIGGLLSFAISQILTAAPTETQRLCLSGHDKDNTVPWKFYCTSGANSGVWTNLPVPSHWDMHGFGTLTYRQDDTNAHNEHGLYQHDFGVPAEWKNQRVFLVFEGVMTDTAAKLNGVSVGPVHQGGFYRFKYEVTQLIKSGATNRLEVDVARHSANKSVNGAERQADFWVFAGIYRPVYLEAVPEAFIERVAIDAKADGAFGMDVFVDHAPKGALLEAQIMSLTGEALGPVFTLPVSSVSTKLQAVFPSPRPWTAETPNLYQVEVRLKLGNDILHVHHQRFGFRTMEVRAGDGIYVNGHKIILKGVNRHSFWPDSGRCLSETVHRMDIKTIKEMNGNAVRMSHYPPDVEFLDLCDELGLYVLDELAGWHNRYDTKVGTRLVEEMVTRDVNHPSILFWDNGNEGGWNTNLDRLFGQFDPQQRRVLHPWGPFEGIDTSHYLSYDRACVAAGIGKPVDVKTSATTSKSRLIYMPTEFLHGLFDGGAGAGLEDYWHMMMTSTNCAGGFIWALMDEAVKRPDTGRLDTAENQAPDGIVGPYREREGSFYVAKKLWSPIEVQRESETEFTIKNHYSFTDANQCQFRWQLRRFPTAAEASTNYTVLAEDTAKCPSIPPEHAGVMRIKFPWKIEAADAVALRVTDPGGKELWTWVWPAKRSFVEMPFAGLKHTKVLPVKTLQNNEFIRLNRGELTVQINRNSGRLQRVEQKGKVISLNNGPRLAVGDSVLQQIQLDQKNGEPVVTVTYSGALKQVVWRLLEDGWLRCDYTYQDAVKAPYFGVLFDYPEALVQGKRWLGDGPYRVWKNRQCGGTLNVWANTYNNTITGYRDWLYPEFKGCFANVRWLQLDTREGLITVVPENIPFLQVLTPELPPTNILGNAFAILPSCGLGFLQAIPPIGSKFNGPETTGPQGRLDLAGGAYNSTINFHFENKP